MKESGNVPVDSRSLIRVSLARGPFRKRWISAGSNDNQRLHPLSELKRVKQSRQPLASLSSLSDYADKERKHANENIG